MNKVNLRQLQKDSYRGLRYLQKLLFFDHLILLKLH